MVDLAAILLLSYLFGSIPTSILAGRLMRGIDIREHGSGNAGATNTFRVLGWKAGLVVAVIDVAALAVPPLLARAVGRVTGDLHGATILLVETVALVGAALAG